MESKNIIIILIVIIAILAVVVGVMFLQPINTKEPTKIRVTSNNTLTEGDALLVQLTDLNKTPISKEIVNITITNSKGEVVVDNVVKTNSKGLAKLDLHLKKGIYNVSVSYAGNENYTGNNTTQELTIKEKVVEAQQSSSSSNGGSSESSVWYDSEGNRHYYENGQEYVGSENKQHMTVEMHNYVKEHGMGD